MDAAGERGRAMSELPIAGSYRPTVMGMEGVVASGHYLASLAAQRILDQGGNAIDAGVAAGLCTCVLQIDMVDLAGVAPIMIYLAHEDRVVTISGLGRWPQAASVEYFHTHHGGRIPVGVERCITPAAPDAFYRGDMAREIAAFYQEQGGLLTYDDLATCRAQIEAPVRVSFHAYD